MSKLLSLLALVQLALSASIANDLIITLPDGQVQGTTYKTQTNKIYYGFRGIPFAAPPVGALRFEAPQPPQPWDGIWDASKDSKVCVTADYLNNLGTESEDCLYVNVYTPSLKPAEKLPVMFWIYGGGFTSGNSSKGLYGPDFLIEEDVIIVSFNYRLTTFGFLSTGDTAIRGNFGLKDQVFAMQWVHDNIEYFGGDPAKVTIFGQSAGGASTGLQVLSKKSAGLYRAAIIQSASALTPWAIDQDPKANAFLLADALAGGDYKNDTQKLKEFLQEKTTEEIITATVTLPIYLTAQAFPVIEVDGVDAFLTESPYELLQSGRFNQVPIVIGICAAESLMFIRDLDIAKQLALLLDTSPNELIPSDLRQNSSDEQEVIKAIQNIYLKKRETFSSNFVALADYDTDNIIVRGVIKYAELSSSYVPVYLYQFAYYGRAFVPAFIDGAEKASHSAELPFLFNMSSLSGTSDSTDLITQQRVVQLWTNFAKFLNPTPEKSQLTNNIIWPTISRTDLQFVNINETLELRSNLRKKSYPQWNNIYKTYGKRPFITY